MDLTEISIPEQLRILKDALKAKQSDYLRIKAAQEPNYEQRLEELEEQASNIQAEIDRVEARDDG